MYYDAKWSPLMVSNVTLTWIKSQLFHCSFLLIIATQYTTVSRNYYSEITINVGNVKYAGWLYKNLLIKIIVNWKMFDKIKADYKACTIFIIY